MRSFLDIKQWWSGGLESGLIINVINSRVSRKFFPDVISSTYECAMMQWGLFIDSGKNEKEKNQIPSSMAIYCFLKYKKSKKFPSLALITFFCNSTSCVFYTQAEKGIFFSLIFHECFFPLFFSIFILVAVIMDGRRGGGKCFHLWFSCCLFLLYIYKNTENICDLQGRLLPHNISMGVIISNHSLVLQSVSRTTAGNYSCVGYNSEGDGESLPFELNVMCK